MTDELKKAWKQVFKKWEDLSTIEGDVPECAFCKEWNNDRYKCKPCPVYKYTGRRYCYDSPYEIWASVPRFSEKEKEYAQMEYMFLQLVYYSEGEKDSWIRS